MLSGQAAAAERIVFPYENVSDLRGLLNVFTAFESACLNQPVTVGLPESLLPEGYEIVSPAFHLLGMETGAPRRGSVVSKTGTEEEDFAAGEPIIDLRMPTDANPDGECRIVWNRAWDYTDHIEDIMFDLAAGFVAQVSFYLEAVLDTRPDETFRRADQYSVFNNWRTPCWDGKTCTFEVNAFIHPEDGIYLTVTRRDAAGGPN